ncbi:hypothetical protein NVS55_36365 [Myxococcus stipitatus]|uniref:hypothetical protein n=1 Tax=Myxococcus stipitatus TaxID=83455 RepID=UPI00314509A0
MDSAQPQRPNPVASFFSESLGCLAAIAVVGGVGWLLWLGAESAWTRLVGADAAQRAREAQAAAETARLANRIALLEEMSAQHAASIRHINNTAEAERTVSFSPGARGYQTVRSGNATFLLKLEKVVPYVNGQRLTFHVANPQSVMFHDPTVTVKWAPKRPEPTQESDYFAAMSVWESARRSKTETILMEVRPGWWTPFSIVVDPATPDDVADIEVSMVVSKVSGPTR